MSVQGAVNGWLCKTCARHTYVVHVDSGVTPMFLACRVGDCTGMGVSLMYPSDEPPQDVVDAIAYEWYLPTREALRHVSPEMQEHIEKGGLALRELTDAGRRQLGLER